MDYLNAVISILSGLAVCIPLVIKLVGVVKEAARNKNWNLIVSMVTDYMIEAEKKFEHGADKKDWVMRMIQTGAKSISYTLTDEDIAKIGGMIDEFCSMSKALNVKNEK